MTLAVALTVIGTGGAAAQAVIHDDPWYSGATYDEAADAVFGAGGWTHYGIAAAANAFTAGNRFVWFDGGNGTDQAFVSFLTNNTGLIENWVLGGGRLVLNAAAWTFPGFDLLFDVMSTDTRSSTGTAANPMHGIFGDRGWGDSGLDWTGGWFSHNYLTGTMASLITDADGRTSLGEQQYGQGCVIYGGLTTNNFHSPNSQALTRNIMDYAGNDGGCASMQVVPEPMTMVLLGTGLFGLGVMRRRRRRA